MTGIVSVKTNFTAGQISNNLFGRGDLGVYENGARCLENVIIHPTGGISRRNGMRYIDELECEAKIVPFEFNSEQIYLLCFIDKKLCVYRDEKCIATIETPWGLEHHAKLNWTQSADTLIVVHPDVAPKKITRNNDEVWKIEDWEYYTENNVVHCPYFNFYQRKAKITPAYNVYSGLYTLTCDKEIFIPQYVGLKIKMNGGVLEITQISDIKTAIAKTIKTITLSSATTDWEEPAFSSIRGWPNSVAFHQDRMVIGGSKSLPNRLWFSKSSDLFNFDLGTGLDDEAIEFAILSDQVNAICNIVSSRHLLVFTTGAEWMVSGDTLSPTNIQLSRQTNTGSYNKYSIEPLQVNGATIFVSFSGKQLREFLYTDAEQAYLSKDLSLLASDVIKNPICASFSKDGNVLYYVLGDGSISCLTSYRTEEVTAWSRLNTKGEFVSITSVGEDIYFVVKRKNRYFLEKSDDEFFADCAMKLTSSEITHIWEGLDIFEGEEVAVVSKGYNLGKYLVEDGKISLFEETDEILVGLPYEHVVEPLPFMLDAVRPFSPKAIRIIDAAFRIINTKSFCVDLGSGYLDVPLKRMFKDKVLDSPPMIYSGDVELKSLRWVRDLEKPAWSIRSDIPLAFNLLSVVLKVKIKN